MSTSRPADDAAPRTGAALRVRLAGVPVTVRPSIVLLLAFFGLDLGDPVLIALWVGIGIASIVVHELGHALVARWAGADPVIELAGLGGVTSYAAGTRARRRGWSVAISLAGPGVGLVVGAATLAAGAAGLLPTTGTGGTAVQFVVFTSIGWSVFNLLPVLPLDGGQTLRALLPGTPAEQLRRAAWIGVGTGAVVLLAGLAVGQPFVAVFAGFLGMQNYQTATGERRREDRATQLGTAVDERRWRDVRDALAAGGGTREVAVAAQQGAAADGDHQLAAEIGEVAIARGARDAGFVERTAAAWEALGLTDRAARVRAGDARPDIPDAER